MLNHLFSFSRKMSIAYSLRGLLDTNKLEGKNFEDWLRNIRIVLIADKLLYVLDTCLVEPAEGSSEEEVQTYGKWTDDSRLVQCVMLGSMTPELQKQCEDMVPSVMLTYLNSLFASKARTERYEISKRLFRLRMSEGSSVQAHVLKMIEWIRRLDKLGFELSDELSIDLILQSLPDSFNPFIMNYNMNKIESSLDELLNMLVVAEGGLHKEAAPVMVVGRANNGKRKGPTPPKKKKKKTKLVKGQAPVKGKKKGEKDSECHRCKKKGHWARNCRAILTEGIFVIDLCLSMR